VRMRNVRRKWGMGNRSCDWFVGGVLGNRKGECVSGTWIIRVS
jgi:hypothetical protein